MNSYEYTNYYKVDCITRWFHNDQIKVLNYSVHIWFIAGNSTNATIVSSLLKKKQFNISNIIEIYIRNIIFASSEILFGCKPTIDYSRTFFSTITPLSVDVMSIGIHLSRAPRGIVFHGNTSFIHSPFEPKWKHAITIGLVSSSCFAFIT